MMRGITLAGLLAAILCPQLLFAQGTKLWRQSTYQEFEKGKLENVAILSEGFLEAGPELNSVLLTPSTYIWGMVSDAKGNAYLATGSPATLLKVSPDGKSETLFTTQDLSVQAVALGRDGSLFAATLPSGKVFRIRPGQKGLNEHTAQVIFDPSEASTDAKKQPKYIWALAFDGKDSLYIATGDPAAIYRVHPADTNAKPELFFLSDEDHLLSLLVEPDGNLLAGSDGAGLVYRITKDGKGTVLFDSPKKEVSALAESNGRIYVAGVGEKGKSNLPPLPVEGRPEITATVTIVAPGTQSASSRNTLIPKGSEIDELDTQGAPRKLWSSVDEIVYGLHATPEGLLVATGNNGHIFRIREDGTWTDLARATAGQATGFAAAPGGIYVSSSNAGSLYKLSGQPAAQGVFLSDVFDTGLVADWGKIEVNATEGGASGPVSIFARTGNVENPERNWSDWKKMQPDGKAPGLPPARFVQWKAELGPKAKLASVGVNYLTVNVAPVVSDVVVVVGARVSSSAQPAQPKTVTIGLPSSSSESVTYVQDNSGASAITALKDRTAVTARWAASDANGDQLLYDLYVRNDGETNWHLLKSNLKETVYSFDSLLLPDGGYRLKVVASDARSHPPGQGLKGDRDSEHFFIDTTPPVIQPLTAKVEGGEVHAVFTATDQHSPVVRAQYSLDAGQWQYIEPVGKLSDSLVEQYDFKIPLKPLSAAVSGQPPKVLVSDPNEHILTVRVYDRYDNASVAKIMIH